MDSDLEFFKILPKYLLYGLIGLIVTPILATLLLMSEVTLSLTVLLIALYISALIVASSIVVIILAKLLAKKITQKYTNSNITLMTVLSILVICLAYKLLQLIPVFGTILTFAFALVGLGILLKNISPLLRFSISSFFPNFAKKYGLFNSLMYIPHNLLL